MPCAVQPASSSAPPRAGVSAPPAVGEARARHALALEAEAKRRADRGDILIDALRHFVAREQAPGGWLRNHDARDELARGQIFFSVGQIEILERHPAHPRTATQLELRCQRDQGWDRIAD